MKPLSKKYKSAAARQGKKAKVNGAEAESLVESIAGDYLKRGVAEIGKRYEPHKRVGGGAGHFKAVYLGKAGCDYEMYLADGRAGMLELKSRSGLRVTKDAIDSFQQAQLARRVAWGQLAKVIVRLDNGWYLVDYSRWHEGDRKSHNAEQLLEIGCAIPVDAKGRPDFLPLV